ncbi:MAG: zinc ribbon domain-containing protein [Candidatus Methanomethylophilaceae archaeon]|nr:zinc ribbon domain-containing protein [Candidatus Methanomethylophilaceae archaeon]
MEIFTGRNLGFYLIGLGILDIIMAVVAVLTNPGGTGHDLAAIGSMAVFAGIFSLPLFINARKWISGPKYNAEGKAKWGRMHFYFTVLLLYSSAFFFGIPLSLMVLGGFVGLTFTDDAAPFIYAFMAVALVTLVMIRQTMLNPDVVEGFGWKWDKVEKHTGILRLVVLIIAPILIVILLILLGLAVSNDSKYSCGHCGGPISYSGETCPRCGYKNY